MDDLAACIDLCESHGFPAPAAALRALAEGRAPFYLVRAAMRADYAEDEGFRKADVAPPTRRIFREREAAERHAQALTARALRNYRPDLQYGPPGYLTADQFVQEVGAILRAPYELPDNLSPLFPESATDEQLWHIGQLLSFNLFEAVGFDPSPVGPG